ncbi:universal stress protein [Tateyamaria pelophila]|uniref:universal stress protein n=1 Tax=Tateyamaria pelophila TaxID=328415 RepID=UPI001CBEE7BD|nr:universal stress protein [Tateyamaria pelophila]
MFKRIMAPVDLAHVERLSAALDCAADLAKLYRVPITYVGVTSSAPSKLAHNPEEFGQRLGAFAEQEAAKHGVETATHTAIAHDPTTEIDDALMRAIGETGADLVVMASHVPNVMDYIWPSNGGKLAEHAKCSVMVVRA